MIIILPLYLFGAGLSITVSFGLGMSYDMCFYSNIFSSFTSKVSKSSVQVLKLSMWLSVCVMYLLK